MNKPQFTLRVQAITPDIVIDPISGEAVIEAVGGGGSNLRMSLVRVKNEDFDTFASYRDFLNQTFDKVETTQNDVVSTILKHSDYIAGRTRRGAGNIIEISPKSLFDADSFLKSYPNFVVVRNDNLLESEIFLYYEGRRDDPAILDGGFFIQEEAGEYVALILKNTAKSIANASDYGVVINII